MGPSTSFAATMREHVEIAYPAELESQPFKVGNMNTEGCTTKQLSLDKESGEGTEEVECPEGWTTEIGHFNHDMECFVLEGDLDIGGFSLHKYSYTFVPAGIAVGPFKAVTKCKLLWMPFGYLEYSTEDYKGLTQKGASTLHKNTLDHPRYGEYIPCVDTPSMPWKQTSLLPPGSARKSLRGTVDGPSSWILGLVPQWIEGNFLASHPTSEETYTLEGSIGGHWSMADDPFNRRHAVMEKTGYYWRPAHVPHGPFYTDTGCMLFFRTQRKLECHWQIHDPDYSQQGCVDRKYSAAGKVTFHGSE